MRKRHVAVALSAVALAVVGGLTYRWTFTPFGRLDWQAAFSLHLLTFDYTFKPDPSSNFELTLPINLFYPLSMLLPAEDVRKVEDVAIPAGERSIAARVYWPDSVDPGERHCRPSSTTTVAASSPAAWRSSMSPRGRGSRRSG